MGVHGLWKLIEPSGQMVPLESLAGKVLAVDISIWLHQAVKGMHDAQGAPVAVAHLLILFHRLCKLLFYKIKPVFVFDGGVPLLKSQTMAARRQRSTAAKSEALKVREKLIKNLLKHEAVRQVLSNETASAALGLNSFTLPGPSVEEDLYKLPPIAADYADSESSEVATTDEEEEKHAEDIHSIDVTSQEFLSLPAEVRHDILTELIETRKQSSWKNLDSMPKQSDNFSDFQMNRLLKRHAVQTSLEKAGKEMGGRALSLKELESLLGDQGVLDPKIDVPSRRIAQDNTTRYMLIQRDTEEAPGKFDVMDHLEDVDWSSESDTDVILEKRKRPEVTEAKNQNVKEKSKEVRLQEEVADILSILEDTTPEVKPNTDSSQSKAFLTNNSESIKEMTENNESVTTVERTVTEKECPRAAESPNKSPTEVTAPSTVDRPSETKTLLGVTPPAVELNTQNEEVRATVQQPTEGDITAETEKMNFPATSRIEPFSGTKTVPEVTPAVELKTQSEEVITTVQQSVENDITADTKKMNFRATSITEPISGTKTFPEKTKTPAVESKEVKSILQQPTEGDITADTQKINFPATSKIDLLSEPKTVPEVSPAVVETDTRNEETQPTLQQSEFEIPAGTDKVSDSSSDSESDFVPITTAEMESILPPTEKTEQNVPPPKEPDTKSDSLTVVINPSEMSQKDDLFADVFETVGEEGQNENRKNEFKDQISAEELSRNLQEEQLVLMKEKGKQERHALNLTDQIYTDAQELLRLFGVPFVVAPMEAEAQCAALNVIGLTEGTITDDSDIWLFGGRVVYKNFFNQNKHVLEYRSENIEKNFKLTREEMIKMALLVGSDYTVGLNGIGPVTALEIIASFQTPNHGAVESLSKFREWFMGTAKAGPPRTSLRKKMKNTVMTPGFPSRAVVEAYLHPLVDDSKEPFSWAKPNLDLIHKYVRAKMGWSTEKCNDLLLPVLKKLEEKSSQSLINRHFKISQKPGVTDGMLSKRVENAIKRLGKNSLDSDDPEEEPKPKKKRKSNTNLTERPSPEEKLKKTGKPEKPENPKKAEKPEVTDSKASLKEEAAKLKLIKDKLYQNIKVPQKEMAQKLLEEKKKEAIRIFRTYGKAKKKTKVFAKEEANLSESSSESD